PRFASQLCLDSNPRWHITFSYRETARPCPAGNNRKIRASGRRNHSGFCYAGLFVNCLCDGRESMTAHSLTRIVSEELAAIGILKFRGDNKLGIPRRTVWSLTLPGFGIRHYSSGRKVYVLQSTMAGKQRLVTLGNASILTRAEAI